jgi:hypothetical protein
VRTVFPKSIFAAWLLFLILILVLFADPVFLFAPVRVPRQGLFNLGLRQAFSCCCCFVSCSKLMIFGRLDCLGFGPVCGSGVARFHHRQDSLLRSSVGLQIETRQVIALVGSGQWRRTNSQAVTNSTAQ